MLDDKIKIAGEKKVGQWKILKHKIELDKNNQTHWNEAFEDYLVTRIETRYLNPIKAISKISKHEGEGFSIIAIYCSLIEFFHTLRIGIDFKHPHYYDQSGAVIKSSRAKDKKTGQFLPLRTEDVFIDFLIQNEPFRSSFDESLAKGFYHCVRCAILHEAQTKKNWTIRNGRRSTQIVESTPSGIKLNRYPFDDAFKKFLNKIYKVELLNSEERKNAFLFKWEKICQI